MGYSLYWNRPIEIKRAPFIAIVTDFKQVLPYLQDEFKVKLAADSGQGQPCINEYGISLNGAVNCGHRNSMPDYGGMMNLYLRGIPFDSPKYKAYLDDDWVARRCPGDCSFDGFHFPRIDWQPGLNLEKHYWSSCKTNRRHYELAIQVILIAAKHHLGPTLLLDGVEAHWADARSLCQRVLGYGQDMALFEEPVKKAA